MVVMPDITSGLTDQGRTITLVVSAALALILVATIGFKFSRSDQKDRWVDRLATVLVLAWTSEGMWEVATKALHLPTPFVIASFFVAEAMMVASAMRATRHRARKGVPGPAGRNVWVLAALFGSIVALNTGSLVGFLLRLGLPLAATTLWWQGITAERDTDTEEMRQARKLHAEEREARWAVTPRSLLVRWGVLKPGNVTVTEAQRQQRIDRMVAARIVIHTGGRGAEAARLKLRKMARSASPDMISEVQRQVQQALTVEDLTGLAPSATNCNESATTDLESAPSAGASVPQRPATTMDAIDPQLAAVIRNGRGQSGAPSGVRNGKNAQVSTTATPTATDRSDGVFMAIVQPLVARSLDATGAAPSQRSVRNEIAGQVQPAPGFKKVGELIERATQAHRERSERGATSATEDRNDDPDRPHINGHKVLEGATQ